MEVPVVGTRDGFFGQKFGTGGEITGVPTGIPDPVV